MFPCLLPLRVTPWNCPATSRLPFSPIVFALSSIFVTILLSPFTREYQIKQNKQSKQKMPMPHYQIHFQLWHSRSVPCGSQALVRRKDFGRPRFFSWGFETREVSDWQRQGNGCWRLQMPSGFLSCTHYNRSYEIGCYRYVAVQFWYLHIVPTSLRSSRFFVKNSWNNWRKICIA